MSHSQSRTKFGPEGFEVSGYKITDLETSEVLGVVYKRTNRHQVMGNGGRSRIAVGHTESSTWHYQMGTEWSWLRKADQGWNYTLKDTVDELINKVARIQADLGTETS